MNYNRGANQEPNNRNLNAQGSKYAQLSGAEESIMIQKLTQKTIFDAAPKRFMDLKILNMMGRISVKSDEFFFQEAGYQRNPLTVSTGASAGSVHTIGISNVSEAANNMIVVYDGNERGNIINIDEANGTITVSAQTGETLPVVAAGSELAILSPVEADSTDEFAYYSRMSTIEKYNYVQLFSKAMKYGEVEMFKYQNAGTTSDFIYKEKLNMNNQFRIDISNAIWNGKKGEVTLKNGLKAKTMGGIYPTMIEAGSTQITCDLDTLREAFEEAVIASEYGDYGDVRYALMEDRLILALSKAYGKSGDSNSLIRYTPDSSRVNLIFKAIELGSSTIVLVPFKRLEDSASFPKFFKDLIFIMDFKNVQIATMWGERSGETNEGRGQGGAALSKTIWVDGNYSLQFNKPLGCAIVRVNRS